MQDKSKTNTVLLVIIIILLCVGLIYIFYKDNNFKRESKVINSNLPIDLKQSSLNTDIEINKYKTYNAVGFSFQYDASAGVEFIVDEGGSGPGSYGVSKVGGVFENIRMVNTSEILSPYCEQLKLENHTTIINGKTFDYCDSKAEPARTYLYNKNGKTLIINTQGSNGNPYSYIIPESVEIF